MSMTWQFSAKRSTRTPRHGASRGRASAPLEPLLVAPGVGVDVDDVAAGGRAGCSAPSCFESLASVVDAVACPAFQRWALTR